MDTEATSTHEGFHIVSYGVTDVGLERKNNEDAFRIVEDAGLYVVCDGMGGHASGELASRIAADAIVEFATETIHAPNFRWPYNSPTATTVETRVLDSAVRMANRKVHEAAVSDPRHKGMGTTVVALFAGRDGIGGVHVGDSRIYRLRAGALEQLTDDHSLLNHYKKTRNMTEEQLRNFKGKNVIVRAVGLRDSVQPDVHVFDMRGGDIMLLCTDGLTDLVPDDRIQTEMELGATDLQAGVNHLLQAALAKGGKDNITIVMLRILDGGGANVRETESEEVFEDTSPGFEIGVDDGNWDQETLPAYETAALDQLREVPHDGDTPDAMPVVPPAMIIDMATDPHLQAVSPPAAGTDSKGAPIPMPPGAAVAASPAAPSSLDSKGAPIPPPPGTDSKGAPIPLPPGVANTLPPGIVAETVPASPLALGMGPQGASRAHADTPPAGVPGAAEVADAARAARRPPSAQLKATRVDGPKPRGDDPRSAQKITGRSSRPPKAESPFARTRVEARPPSMDVGAAPVAAESTAASEAAAEGDAPPRSAASLPAGDVGQGAVQPVGAALMPETPPNEMPTAPYLAVVRPPVAAAVTADDALNAEDIFNVPTLEMDVIPDPADD